MFIRKCICIAKRGDVNILALHVLIIIIYTNGKFTFVTQRK